MKERVCERVRRLAAYVPGEQPREPGLVKLNTNENPYPPSPLAVEAGQRIEPAELRRYPDPLNSEVRRAVAEIHGVAEEQVFAGNGSDEILALCSRAFVEDGGRIGYLEPSYSLYPVLAAIRGVETVPVSLDERFDWNGDAPDADLFFLTTPHAPTGRCWPVEAVSGFCRRFDGVVVLDEAYAEFAPTDGLALARGRPNVLVVRTLSKAYALAGLRVGYAMGAPELIAALFKIKDSYNLDRFSQRVAAAALRDQAHMRANVAKIRATRERLAGRLREMGFEVHPSETNFLWVRPSGITAVGLLQALRKEGVLVRWFSGARTEAYLRITIGTDAEIDRLLAALHYVLDTRA